MSSTFYAHFSGVGEVLQLLEDDLRRGLELIGQETAGQWGAAPPDEPTLTACFRRLYDYVDENRALFRLLAVEWPEPRFLARWKSLAAERCDAMLPRSFPERHRGLARELSATTIVGSYAYWLAHPDEVTAEDLAMMARRSFEALS